MAKLLFGFVFSLLLGLTLSYNLFYRGRTRYGLLPPPPFKFDKISATPVFEDNWFEQKLDHFNKADIRTWKQRFFVNDAYYKPGGPVFLMIGGEGPATATWMANGQWINWAKQFNALCFQLEHRYYGESHPTTDMTSENLKYLSSDQALADLAEFRRYMGIQGNLTNAKWIAFGGSYSGALAAWVRLKYPQLFYAAVASSAPVNALINFEGYMDVVTDSLATTGQGQSCNDVISQGVKDIEDMLATTSGPADLKKLFRLCDDLNVTNKKDVANFFATIAGVYQDTVQYNRDNRAFEGAMNNMTIDDICDILADTSLGTPINRMAEVNSVYLDSHETKCADFSYYQFIKFLRIDTWNTTTDAGARQWTYQTCTEFGYYQSSDSTQQPFGNKFPLKFYVNQCADIFGPSYDMNLLNWAVNETNIRFGAKDLKVTRVVFPNGSIDPWHVLGILEDLSPDAPAILINGTAHCADMYPDSENDLPQLIAARQKIGSYLQSWIAGDDNVIPPLFKCDA